MAEMGKELTGESLGEVAEKVSQCGARRGFGVGPTTRRSGGKSAAAVALRARGRREGNGAGRKKEPPPFPFL